MKSAVRQPVATTCPYCGVGCGVLATADGEGGAAIAGDPNHPSNFGKLCSKGSALGETLALERRVLHPMMRTATGALSQVGWDAALDYVAAGLARTIDQHGPDAVAFYLSGQLLTEDYYVANKLMKGFIGSANVDTNSRLCMASTVAGHRRAFGADTVPGCYEDLDEADLIVLVGSNAAWCHPILFRRILQNRETRGARVIVIDPRRTDTAEDCDLFLPLKAGTDSILFAGLLVYLSDHGALDLPFIDGHTQGFDETLSAARRSASSIDAVARHCDLPKADVARFYESVRSIGKHVTCFSQGVNQAEQGTDKVNAIINVHLATGRIGKPGQGPFSFTGQPNAMGGREVGGLANQLAAHMDFVPEDIARVQRFWRAPTMAQRPGLKAVDMFEAVADGRIKALWVMGTNPAVSMPRADAVREAMSRLDLLVISENVASNDTLSTGAHVIFPAAAWGEKSGTVTNSERRISRQRAFLPMAREVRPDWWIVSQIAARLGWKGNFDYQSPADIFREHAALSALDNNGRRDFDLGAVAELTDDEYDSWAPRQWPMRNGATEVAPRLFSTGQFFSDTGRANFVAPETVTDAAPDAQFPLRLNTGRVRDHWHTMTRSGESPRLARHRFEPYAEIHPVDAAKAGVEAGDHATIRTPHGECTVRAEVTDRVQQGTLFVPIHWSRETSSTAPVGALVAPQVDPISGQPDAKATPALLVARRYSTEGVLVMRCAPRAIPESWWARFAVQGGTAYRIASDKAAATWAEWFRQIADIDAELVEYVDDDAGIYRAAYFSGNSVEASIFVGPRNNALPIDHACGALAAPLPDQAHRSHFLAGIAAGDFTSSGSLVCACFGVGRKPIEEALRNGTERSVAAIGAQLKAGTNCGSCVPEIKRIMAAAIV